VRFPLPRALSSAGLKRHKCAAGATHQFAWLREVQVFVTVDAALLEVSAHDRGWPSAIIRTKW